MGADFYSFRPLSDGHSYVLMREMIARVRNEGATWVRVTRVNRAHREMDEGEEPFGLWVEGWRERPDYEGPFDPPLERVGP